MKKIICFILALSLFGNIALADSNCDWSTIKKLPNGDYDYSPALNICVGTLVEQSKTNAQVIADLTAAIALKNQALLTSDSRIALWQNTANSEQDRLEKIESDQHRSDFLYFALGVVAAIGTGYTAAKLAGR